jgi:hypothetical protein
MFGASRNDWHADHGMSCENPNTSNRTIHLTSQQQAGEAAYYYCAPDGNADKAHVMTTVNTEGYVTVWFSPKPTFRNVSKVCWDQNITDLGGGKWTVVNLLTPAEYTGKTDLGYTSPDFPGNGGPTSPQGPAANGVKVFRGTMNSYTNKQFHDGARGVTVSDKAARYKHCVIDNGNGTLTTTIAQPNGTTVSRTVIGNIPDGDIRVQFGDDNYNPDKHFDTKGAAPNSTGLYTWHWDNIQIYAAGSTNQTGGGNIALPTVAFSASPSSISPGKISTVTWSSTNAASCMAGGGWTGAKATSGTLAVSPPSTTSYTLACTGAGGTSPVANATVAVGASPAPINGACGSANGTTVSSAPSTNLCSTGTSSTVTGSGPWTWSCGGSNGGTSLSCSASASGTGSIPTPTPTPTPAPSANACKMQLGGTPAFCDTFDTAAGTGNRSGQLNGTLWGVSRWTGDMNFGSSYKVPWVSSKLMGCNGPQSTRPDTDIIICNGQLRQATNDNATGSYEAGTVTAMTIYPKQPFNFAGRTGTISFDVSNDTQGTHGAWPELWVTSTPMPAPFLHFSSAGSGDPHAFGIRFAGSTVAGQGAQLAPNCPNDNNIRWTVDSFVAVRNHVVDDTQGYGTRSKMTVTPMGCVIASSGANGGLNHVEVQVSQNQVDVYATDAGKTTPLIHIAKITDVNLSFTQGLIWLEDVHYNADKSLRTPLQHDHTFTWDNVAFDGPRVARDLSYDVLDSLTPCHDGTVCLGYESSASQPAQVNTLPIAASAISATQGQYLMFTAYAGTQPSQFSFTLNGHAYSFPWPLPHKSQYSTNSFMFPVKAADLVAGPNAIRLWSDQYMIVANINIVLAGAGGVPPANTANVASSP